MLFSLQPFCVGFLSLAIKKALTDKMQKEEVGLARRSRRVGCAWRVEMCKKNREESESGKVSVDLKSLEPSVEGSCELL